MAVSDVSDERVNEVHASAIVVDGLGAWGDLEKVENSDGLRQGGHTAVSVTVAHLHDFKTAVQRVSHFKSIIRSAPDKLVVAETVRDIREAKEADVLAIILSFQDTRPIEKDLGYIELFYNMGIRIIQLTYNTQNFVGAGCCELDNRGLTYFGREVISSLGSMGIVVDVSHCCEQTTLDAIKYSKNPVIASHASALAVSPAGRNKSDRVIRALADKGGVIGVTFQPFMVKMDKQSYEALPSTSDDVVKHIDHIVSLVGIDHVAFGSDLTDAWTDRGYPPPESSFRTWRTLRPDCFGKGPTDSYDKPVEGLKYHRDLPNLTRSLLQRGYSTEDVHKVLGGNFLRVFLDVWKG